MVEIIETKLLMKGTVVTDHQSRVIKVKSWEDYIEEFITNKSVDRISILGNLCGLTIPINAIIENLVFDEKHLSCDIINLFFNRSKIFAYKI